MKEFTKNPKKQKFIYSIPMMVILFFAIVLLLVNTIDLIQKNNETKNKKLYALSENEELIIQKESIKKEVDNLESVRGQEEIIREKFSVVKEGEGVVVVIDEDLQNTENQSENKKSFINFFKNLFKKKPIETEGGL